MESNCSQVKASSFLSSLSSASWAAGSFLGASILLIDNAERALMAVISVGRSSTAGFFSPVCGVEICAGATSLFSDAAGGFSLICGLAFCACGAGEWSFFSVKGTCRPLRSSPIKDSISSLEGKADEKCL